MFISMNVLYACLAVFLILPVFVLKLKSDKATLGINTQTKSLKVYNAVGLLSLLVIHLHLTNYTLQVVRIIYQTPTARSIRVQSPIRRQRGF